MTWVPAAMRVHVFFGGLLKALGPVTVRDRVWLIDRIVTDRYLRAEGKIIWDKHRRSYHLCVAIRVRRPPDPDPDLTTKRVVAMDPGVRRFQTLYDPATGAHGELLSHYYRVDHHDRVLSESSVREELHRRCTNIDALQACLYGKKDNWRGLWDRGGPPGRHGRRLRAAYERGELSDRSLKRHLHCKMLQSRRHARRHLRRELARLADFKHAMHYASQAYLWRHWDTVVVSTASFGSMCETAHRPFGSRVARTAMCWGHYGWRMRLLSGAFRRAGCYVVETSEEYTTKTCGLCGVLNHTVGAAETFRCTNPACGIHIDRDVNGARNIGLKVLTKCFNNIQ